MNRVIGPSGSGKSTLLRCVNLLEVVDDGTITLDGVDITDPRADADRIRTQVGIVFQSFNLFPHMSALDNITLARAIKQYGLKVTQLWFDGYDASLLNQYSSLMQGEDRKWLARLKAAPVAGRANEELIALVAAHFGCRKSAVTIKSGLSGRTKLVRIEAS